MKKFEYVITDALGIHARPAGQLVKEVKQYQSTVTIEKEDKAVDATRLMAVMGLGVKKGQKITIVIEGKDEEAACAGLEKFLKENL